MMQMPKPPLPLVRLAAPEDEGDVLAMCERLHQENGLFSLSLERVKECLQRYYQRQGAIVGVIGAPGKLEASTCLELSTFYYTNEHHLAELWNFVDAPYRRSQNAEALIQFCKKCADEMKMPLFTGIITNRQMAGKVRLYRRYLGYPTGAFFVYNSHWRSEPMEDYTELRNRLREKARALRTQAQAGASVKVQKKEDLAGLASLLREAADAIDSADSLWGAKSKSVSVS